MEWPPTSSDLTLLEFSSWGNLKIKVCKTVENIDNFRPAISQSDTFLKPKRNSVSFRSRYFKGSAVFNINIMQQYLR